MSKGNLFVGSASGKVGNLVLANTKAGQVTRVYQPKVSNPKSAAQMRQRARFANALKFFKQSVANFYHFAYEDKKSNESDYNAFMRHNIMKAVPMSREAYLEPTIPAVGNKWLMSDGRLNFNTKTTVAAGTVVNIPGLSAVATLGDISKALVAQGAQAGDIVTIVNITTSVNASNFENAIEDGSNFTVPAWTIAQFIVDESSTVALSAVPGQGSLAASGVVTLAGDASAATISLGSASDNAQYGAFIVTRKQDSGLQCTSSELEGNDAAAALLQSVNSDSAIAAAIQSWGAKGDAILKGAIANK